MTVGAVIPNWNRAALLSRLLGSMRAQTRAFDDVVVVDNGSTDESRTVAESAGARVIALDRNYGFAYAVNRGIEAMATDRVAILNNDVVLRADWLAKMLRIDAPFACGMVLREDDPSRIDGTFDLVTRGGLAWRAGSGELATDPRWRTEREIAMAPWTAVVVRRETFQRVGLLDETFGSYLEDVDWGIRCAVAGISGRYVPSAVSVHRGSATLGAWQPETVRLMARNQMLLIAKHYPRRRVWRYACQAVIGQALWGISALRQGCGSVWWGGKREGGREWRNWRRDGSGATAMALCARELRRLAPNAFWRIAAWLG